MHKKARQDEHAEETASAQHVSDMLDEALDEGFPASDPVAIHVDPEETADNGVEKAQPTGASVRSRLPGQ